MNLPVVVGVDGSEASLRAVDWAADEAVLHGASLHVVFAALWERYEGAALARELGKPSARVIAGDIVDAAVGRARLRRPHLSVDAHVLWEEAENALVRMGRDATVLVVGARGRSGLTGMVLGSVSMAVAARADRPVVVVRGGHDDRAGDGRHDRIAVGVGVAMPSALRFAFEEARLRAVPLDAVCAWRCPTHEPVDHPLLVGHGARVFEQRAAEALEEALHDAPTDVTVHRHTPEGPARRVLLHASHEADLLVIGRRSSGRPGPRLGRVAHTVLHHAVCPVAVVPEPG
ncbi:universal stress protein [Streptomyces sp. JHA26]|uniref:universal stress protein n=1 Tax=Streptomyces sp. JHA26 TaxID=1917143 RepID=UPI00098B1FAD|nr:universal stress protein [Streptomyces sp. JHA26]